MVLISVQKHNKRQYNKTEYVLGWAHFVVDRLLQYEQSVFHTQIAHGV